MQQKLTRALLPRIFFSSALYKTQQALNVLMSSAYAKCLYTVAYPRIRKSWAKHNGAAHGQGRTLPRGRHVKILFFVCAACKLQPPPAENHLLHTEVAQVGIERKINAEAVWPLRCRFLTPRLP